MHYTATGSAAAGSAAYAIMADAVKASGAIIRVEPSTFNQILKKADKPLIIYAEGGFLAAKHQYLTSYRGLTFFAKSNQLLNLPSSSEVIKAGKIWVPS